MSEIHDGCACMGPGPVCMCKLRKLKGGESVTGDDGLAYKPSDFERLAKDAGVYNLLNIKWEKPGRNRL